MAVALAVNTSPDAPEDLRILRLALLGVTAVVALLVGKPLLAGAWQAFRERRLSVEFLFLVTLGGALGVSLQSMLSGSGPVYFEVISILLVVYAFGAQLNRAVRDRALTALHQYSAEIRLARVRDETGADHLVSASQVQPNDILVVLPGEMVPLDGELLGADALFEESHLRGEFAPVHRAAGERVRAGAAVLDSQVRLRAMPASSDSPLDEVLCAVRHSLHQPASVQRAADRLAAWFLPVVASVALLTFLGWSAYGNLQEALFHSMAVLLVACPCALGFATPLALNTALNRFRDLGISLSRVEDVEAMAAVDCVVFDKTGTLSAGEAELLGITWACSAPAGQADTADRATPTTAAAASHRHLNPYSALIAAAESGLSHPYARALAKALPPPADNLRWVRHRLHILPGAGIEAGMRNNSGEEHVVRIQRLASPPDGTSEAVEILVDGVRVATAAFGEMLPADRHAVWRELQSLGAGVHLFTGDTAARAVEVGISQTESALPPMAKQSALVALKAEGKQVLYIGDGLNDAAAMAEASVSLAVVHGAVLAQAVASGLWDGRHLFAIPEALRVARQTLRRIHHNFAWALGYNIAGMALAAAGMLHPVTAALLMVSSSTLVTWRALALLEPTSSKSLADGGTTPIHESEAATLRSAASEI